MSYTLIFSDTARQNFADAHEWYEEQSPGLGEKFESEFQKRINIIKQHPGRFPVRKKLYRECPINKYPYLIVYSFDEIEKEIVIAAVFHTKRNPKRKYKKS
ncbi:MAG: type II toxin-antitoxin system RelE/ParE family toxin [Niabella sp.]|nr:type II toxin-antitoxin system RelE/ParE family toxin [Niabella sp.]